MNLANVSVQDLKRAIVLKNQIDELQRELQSLLVNGTAPAPRQGKRRKMSRAARAKIAAAQKKRWAKAKRGKR